MDSETADSDIEGEEEADTDGEEQPEDNMPDLTEQQAQQINDPAELRRLLLDAQARAAGAAGGGRNKVLLKQDPPSLDECEDYTVWKNKLYVWQAGTALDDQQQAATIIQGVMDDHKHHKKNLSTLMMRTLSRDELRNPTTERVLKFLDDHLLGSAEERVYEAYQDFINCQIKPAEKYEDFVIRFDMIYQTLVKRDADVKIPDKLKALQIRTAAKLTPSMLMSVRANVTWDEDNIYENTKKAINRICHGESNKVGSNAHVKLTTDEGAFDIQREGGCFLINGKEMISTEEAQVFYGEGGRGRGGRGRGERGRGGRGAGRGGDKAQEKKCWNCGKPGHRAANCRKKKEDTEEEECDVLGAELWCTEDDVDYENQDEIWDNLENDSHDETDEEICHLDVYMMKTKNFTVEAEGSAGLDSCCSRTLMGENWFKTYKELIPEKMLKLVAGPKESNVAFTVGNGGKMKSLGNYVIPVQINGTQVMLSVELVKSDIPLLLSKSTMEKCGIILNFAESKITAFGQTNNLRTTSIGHPVIRVIPRGILPFMHGVMLTDEDPGGSYQIMLVEKKKLTEEEQKKMIRKIHKQAGHQTKEKFRRFLEQGSIDWDKRVLKDELEMISKNCHGCILKKRTPDKPAACIPVSYGFNQCVGVDLKINSDGTIILYVIDMWSKLLQARLVRSKRCEEITAAIMDCWVAVYGAFERTIHDNGGEFTGPAFKEMMDLLGVTDGTSAAHSPWSCGIVEKHHAVVDSTYQALLRDFPSYKKETLLQWAVFVKNSTNTTMGWSPYQIVYGKNPRVPCLLTSNLAGLREEVLSSQMLENLNALNQARVEVNRALCDVRLKKMMKSKVRRNQTVFETGDKIFWRVHGQLQKWRQGKVLAVDGKVMWVRDGGNVYRVSTDMAVKVNEEYDKDGVLVDQQQAKIAEAIERRQRRVSVQSVDDDEPLPEVQRPQPTSPARPPDDSVDDDELPEERILPALSQPLTGNSISPTHHCDRASSQVSPSKTRTAANSSLSEETRQPSTGDTDEVFEPERTDEASEEEMDPVQRREAIRVMRQTEAAERSRKRKSEATPSNDRKQKKSRANSSKFGEKINIKKGDVIKHGNVECDVGSRLGSVRGKYINTFNLYPRNGNEPYSADLSRVEFEKMEVDEQVHFTLEEPEDCMMDIVPYQLHGNRECMEAKLEELDKIINKYKVVDEVEDNGQVRISCKFVLWYKKSSSGDVKTRARLVARGFEEVQQVDSDSPTMDATSVKIILAYARAKNMAVISADVKAAFLQGLPLTERDVYVQPPKEANVSGGKIWKLRVSLYGLQDASLRFHWKVRTVFKEMGLVQSKLDPAVFYQKNKMGEVIGIIGTHVDDFMIAGDKTWCNKIVESLCSKFELGTVERDNFLYCGHRVVQDKDGNISLSQEEYAKEIKELYISPERKKESQEPVTELERKRMRAYAGKLGWLSRMSRPDLVFAQIEASSAITRATVQDLRLLQKAVMRIREEKSMIAVPKLPENVEDWRLTTFTDASWQNLNGIGSTGGRALFLSGGDRTFAVHWAAHRLRRVCHSSQAAEIMAMNEGLNDASYIRTMLHELSNVWVEGEIITDCKNAFQALTKTTAPTDKRVKCEAAAVRDALMEKEVSKIRLVRGKSQIADVLTKRKTNPIDFLHIAQTGQSLSQLGY